MRLSFRFLVPLVLALVAVAYAVTPFVDGLMRQWNTRDLDIRATLVASSLQDPLRELLATPGNGAPIANRLNDLIRDERLYALAVCDPDGKRIAASAGYPESVRCDKASDPDQSRVINTPQGPLHVATRDVTQEGRAVGSLVVIHDMSFAERRSETTRRYLFYLIAAIAGIVSFITVLIAEFSWREWLRSVRMLLRARSTVNAPSATAPPGLAPVAKEPIPAMAAMR